jgi:hypothetical protein
LPAAGLALMRDGTQASVCYARPRPTACDAIGLLFIFCPRPEFSETLAPDFPEEGFEPFADVAGLPIRLAAFTAARHRSPPKRLSKPFIGRFPRHFRADYCQKSQSSLAEGFCESRKPNLSRKLTYS